MEIQLKKKKRASFVIAQAFEIGASHYYVRKSEYSDHRGEREHTLWPGSKCKL